MRPRLLLLLLCWVLFAGYVWHTGAQLPERVATHFNVSGAPNGWMTRAGHVRFTVLMGIGASAFVLGVFALIRYCGDRGLNIPHKSYWLAPEQREATCDFIQLKGVGFAVLLVCFFAAIHRSIVTANLREVPSLPPEDVGWPTGMFLIIFSMWVVDFVWHFFRKPA